MSLSELNEPVLKYTALLKRAPFQFNFYFKVQEPMEDLLLPAVGFHAAEVLVVVVLALQSGKLNGIKVFGSVECLSSETFQKQTTATPLLAPFLCHFKDC